MISTGSPGFIADCERSISSARRSDSDTVALCCSSAPVEACCGLIDLSSGVEFNFFYLLGFQTNVFQPQDTQMHSRATALQNVESTISELGNIFTQLATMVAQQGELAIRIDDNMDDTLSNVEGAQGALLKHSSRISSNRWLIVKIFFVIIIFIVIFIVFVA
ncbi:syntaxin-32-like [Cryptomeria japonica]|uniref:syntaxin-32-like n=1 Tax=Cryptomeria japonica TaxID=3369 RepID=UPI0027D9EA79|nr:syntaxin-32-like [Cryptomeria japonica]